MSKKLRTRRKKNKGESEGAESATLRDNSEVSQAAYSNFMSEASFIDGGGKVIRPMSVR